MKFFGLDITKSYTDAELKAWEQKMNSYLLLMVKATIAICFLMVFIALIYKTLHAQH